MSHEMLINKVHHGEPLSSESVETLAAPGENARRAVAEEEQSWPFDYIFPDLACQDLEKLSDVSNRDTVAYLKQLGKEEVMVDPFRTIPGVPVPTIYTFFGQFVDHDITHEKKTEPDDLSGDDLQPLTFAKVKELQNARSPNLELDSVYGSVSGVIAPRDPVTGKLRIDEVVAPEDVPRGNPRGKVNDLPRRENRFALIGDARNDENIITAQLHVAFLHAHNTLIDAGYSFKQARKLLIQHYQWIVLEDFLPRVADPMRVKKIKNDGAKFFNPSREKFFTPLEFSVAAYRFGHSKVRSSYFRYNERTEMSSVDLFQLFDFTRFSGELGDSHITGNWVIDWKGFLNPDSEDFFSRPIDTTLAQRLFDIQRDRGNLLQPEEEWKKNLAVRNLLRGYYLRIPTGQAIAEAMNVKDKSIVPLTPCQIASAVTEPQRYLMEKARFLEHTPLWFYILAEAVYYNKGYHLGPVGSTIVAETLIGILRHSDHSILKKPGWRPTLGLTPGKFDLEDLLILAGVYIPDAS